MSFKPHQVCLWLWSCTAHGVQHAICWAVSLFSERILSGSGWLEHFTPLALGTALVSICSWEQLLDLIPILQRGGGLCSTLTGLWLNSRCPNLYSYWEGFIPLSLIHRVSFLSSRGIMFGFKEVVELRNFDSSTSSLFSLSSAFCSPTLSLFSLLYCSHKCVTQFLKSFYCSQACQWVFSSGGFPDEYSKEKLGYYFFLTILSNIWVSPPPSSSLHCDVFLLGPGHIPYLSLWFETGEWLMIPL